MRAMNSAIRLAVIAASTLLISQPAARAQQGTVAVASIPFAFQINEQHLPAGRYTVRLQSDHILRLSSKTDSGFIEVNWGSAKYRSKTGVLVFHRYGNQYFLREMSFGPGSDLLTTPQSKQERDAQKEGARVAKTGGPTQQSDVDLALTEPSK